MNRLTARSKNREAYYPVCVEACDGEPQDCGNCDIDKDICDRLAAYEDTGLEPDEIPQLEAQLDAALEDLYYIHCAGQKGCKICRNAGQCGESDSHIGDCAGFEWRGPQPPKEEKRC
jgi:hypothetical protein